MSSSLRQLLCSALALVPLFVRPAAAVYGQIIRVGEGLEAGGTGEQNTDYYNMLIKAHATFATLTFLFVIPAAIISVRYTKHIKSYGGWFRKHAFINVITVTFITIVFTLGYLAVQNSGQVFQWTNVHHRIGLTIFVAILFQFFFGITNSFVLARPHVRTPLQNRLHIVLGWLIYGLGLAQIPVGMVLYGSPRWAFCLYGLTGGIVAVILLVLEALIGRREDHNVDLRTYRPLAASGGEDSMPQDGSEPKPYASVNWNGEITNVPRKMFGFGRK